MTTPSMPSSTWSVRNTVPAANPLASTAGAGAGASASTSLPALTGFQSYMQQARQQPSPPPVAPAPKPPQATAGQSHEEEPARESAHAAPTAPDKPASSRASQKLQARLPSLQGKVDAAAARQAERPSEPTADQAASAVGEGKDEAPADTLAEPREAQPGANDSAQAQSLPPAMVKQAEQAQDDPGEALAGQSKPGSRKADRKGGLDLRGSASPVSAHSRSLEEGASGAGQPASASGPEGFSAQLAKALPQEGPAMGGLTPDASQAGAGGVTGATSQAEAPRAETTATPAFRVSVPVEDSQFPVAIAVQLARLSQNGIDSAQLNLHPAEMGPLQVRLSLGDDGLKVDMSAAHDTTRQVLEQGSADLRLQLEQAGIAVRHVQVHDTEAGSWQGGLSHGGAGQEPSPGQPGGRQPGHGREDGGAPAPTFIDAGLDAGQARSLGLRHQARGLDLFA